MLALAGRWPLGLASSSNREIIDRFLELSGFGEAFAVDLSSEEVGRGKPAPDVYLEAAAALGVDPSRCVAIEDSSNGLRAAAAAGMPRDRRAQPSLPAGGGGPGARRRYGCRRGGGDAGAGRERGAGH